MSRQSYLGGSDVAAVLGMSPFGRSAYDVWAEKTGRVTGEEPVETAQMRRGVLLEPIVLREYARVTGARVRRDRRLRRHARYPFLGGHLDGWSVRDGQRGIVEAKTVSAFSDRDAWGEAGTDEVPPYYVAQVMHYLAITGAPWADVAAYWPDRGELRVYRVPRDEGLIVDLTERLVRWWREHVEGDVPPPPSAREDLSRRWPRHEPGRTVEAGAAEREALARLVRLRREIARLEEAEAEARQALQLAMGDAEALTVDGDVAVTWKAMTVRRLDTAALRREEPEIAERFMRSSEIRRFVVKGEK